MKPLTATKLYALAFGLFLGLCLWKFGNPVILDSKVDPPSTFSEFWHYPWPPHWANWLLLPLAAIGGVLALGKRASWPQSKWLWRLPLAWLGWQFLSAVQTVDANLTTATLWQFSGCVACYFLGAWLLGAMTAGVPGARSLAPLLLMAGILAAFAFCLVRAVDQKVFEYPLSRQMLVEGEQCGWTNYPPEAVAEMKRDKVIIRTNGLDVANPAILEKFKKGRVAGTLVYPNALAGVILLLWPAALAMALGATINLRPAIRAATIALTLFLGSAAFYWSGSKLGWLIALGLAGLFLLRMDWPKRYKITTTLSVLVLGLAIFAVRFQHYFSTGATSMGARFDYWRAAAQTAQTKPVLGTGPGTFQRPYAQIKAPESEMARLTHNDYLEQFSDSGLIGGMTYAAWIVLALVTAGKKLWLNPDRIAFALYAGVLAWFAQGLGEFSLYIPALAWTAFTLLGMLVAIPGGELHSTKKTKPASLAP